MCGKGKDWPPLGKEISQVSLELTSGFFLMHVTLLSSPPAGHCVNNLPKANTLPSQEVGGLGRDEISSHGGAHPTEEA